MFFQRYLEKFSRDSNQILFRQRYALHIFEPCAVHRYKNIGNRLSLTVLVRLRHILESRVYHVIRVVHLYNLALHWRRDSVQHDVAMAALSESDWPRGHCIQVQRLCSLYFDVVVLFTHQLALLVVTREHLFLQPVHLDNIANRLLDITVQLPGLLSRRRCALIAWNDPGL